jgi:hypothetical protein
MDLQLSRALICVDGELDLADVGEFKVEVRARANRRSSSSTFAAASSSTRR